MIQLNNYKSTKYSTVHTHVFCSIADLGRTLFRLFQHPSLAIVKAAGLLMKAIIEVGP